MAARDELIVIITMKPIDGISFRQLNLIITIVCQQMAALNGLILTEILFCQSKSIDGSSR